MTNCAILAIGSELMEGSVIDTNSTFLADRLSKLGFKVSYIRQLPDDKKNIIDTIREVSKSYPLILTTGGLGPTFDDLTAECVADAYSVSLQKNIQAYNHMAERLNRLNVVINKGHERQVMLPDGARLFPNDFGTALGFSVSDNSSIIISMPGVPFEMKPMFDSSAAPFILESFKCEKIFFKDIVFTNIPESDIDDEIMKLGIPEDVQAIINAGKGLVTVKLRSEDKAKIENMAEALVAKFTDNFIAYDGSSLMHILYLLCMKYKKTIAFAESCTGGLMSEMITMIHGSSEIFLGSVVSYSNQSKTNLLSVDKDTLEKHGAVSSETAYLMAKGARERFGADYSISVTGIAGPGGETADKKVGLVYLGFASADEITTAHLDLTGDRETIRIRSVNSAIFKLIEIIKNDNR